MVELNLKQRIHLKFFGWVQVGEEMHDGWKGPLPTYAFRCKYHGLQVSRAYGYGELLYCPQCEKDSP